MSLFKTATSLGLLLLIYGARPIAAQTTFDQLHRVYEDSIASYNQARDAYIEARSEYLKYQTLVSQTAAVEATQTFLVARQQVMMSYLHMMRERVQNANQITEPELKPYLVYMDDAQEQLQAQIPQFEAASDLKDLTSLNTAAKKLHTKVIFNGFKMKTLIAASKIREHRLAGTEIVNLTSDQIGRIRGESRIDVSRADRWLIQANERILLAKSKEDQVLLQDSPKMKESDSRTNMDRLYGRYTVTLGEANQYLKEAKDYLKEIIHDIRFD